MLRPRALLDVPLLLRALRLLSVSGLLLVALVLLLLVMLGLLLVVLVLLLLLLLGLLLVVLVLLLLLLLGLLLVALVLLLLFLLSLLLIVLVLLLLLLLSLLLVVLVLLLLLLLSLLLVMLGRLLLSVLGLRLSMLRGGFALLVPALLLIMTLPLALLLVLSVGRSCDSEKQGQNGCAGDSNYFHLCYLRCCRVPVLDLAQAAGLCVRRVADGIAGDQKFHSPVLLSSGGVIVRSYGQSVAETFGCDRIHRDPLLHQVVTHRAGAVFRQRLIHLISAHIVGVASDFDVESGVGEQNAGDFCQLLPSPRLQ